MKIALACLGLVAVALLGMGAANAAPLDIIQHGVNHALHLAGGAVMAMGVGIPVAHARTRGLVSARADGANVTKILAELQQTFEAFKAEREAELAGIDKKFADVVQTEKVDRINNEITKLSKDLDAINATIAALKVGGAGAESDPNVVEHAGAFNRWFRKGVDAGLSDLEVKAKLTTQSDPDGGYLAPEEVEGTIDRVLSTVSAVRSIARVMSITSDTYKKLVNMGGAGYGWVGEEQARPETTSPSLREIAITTAELYAMPAATQKALDDSRIDIGQWLADEVSIVFGEQEGAAFVSGDGVNKPRGFLAYDAIANASYSWGKLGFVVTGAAAAFASSNPADAIIDLYYSLKAGYRTGASFITSDAVMATIRKFKDGQGNYLWAPPTGPDMPATILGKPVVSDDNMPALGANNFPVAFGNFQRGYLIVDRAGIRILRDPYTSKPNVLFYTTKRVGGGVVNFEALKLLKCST